MRVLNIVPLIVRLAPSYVLLLPLLLRLAELLVVSGLRRDREVLLLEVVLLLHCSFANDDRRLIVLQLCRCGAAQGRRLTVKPIVAPFQTPDEHSYGVGPRHQPPYPCNDAGGAPRSTWRNPVRRRAGPLRTWRGIFLMISQQSAHRRQGFFLVRMPNDAKMPHLQARHAALCARGIGRGEKEKHHVGAAATRAAPDWRTSMGNRLASWQGQLQGDNRSGGKSAPGTQRNLGQVGTLTPYFRAQLHPTGLRAAPGRPPLVDIL